MIDPQHDDFIRGARTLVVDDDRGLGLILRAALGERGFQVQAVPDGERALAAFESRPFDLVLLDILLPGIDGFEVCATLRGTPRGRNLPIIMMTSLDDDESIARAYAAGATDFVTKPLRYAVLAHRMRYVLRANRYLASLDEVTGLPSRGAYLEHLERAIDTARRDERGFAVVFLDLDGFRRINESLGQVAGDALLREVARRLHARSPAAAGADGALARVGDHEFALTLPATGRLGETSSALERLARTLADPFRLGEEQVAVTASTGVSVYPVDGADAPSLFKAAELAAHHRKSNGRNGHQFYHEGLDAACRRRFRLEAELRRALECGQLELHYQPLISLDDDAVVAMEALMRWHHPELGEVPPDEFVPVAEECGLIHGLGEWALASACAEARGWHEAGHTRVRVAVNCSPLQLRGAGLADHVARITAEAGLEPSHLEIELTENALLGDTSGSIEALAALAALGVALSIDDFGTGYSSLAYLRRFALRGLKIDRTFVADMTRNSEDATIVSTIIHLGHNLGLKVVAEGVETREQLLFLRAYGCDEAQGFVIARPMCAAEVPGWLAARRAAGERASARGARLASAVVAAT